MSGAVEKVCAYCEKTFPVAVRFEKKRTGNQRYCSRECAQLARTEANKQRIKERVSIKCEICGKWTRIRHSDQEEHGTVCAACRDRGTPLVSERPHTWYPHNPAIGSDISYLPPDAPGGLINPAM